jgi:glycogen(starch) synthase
VKIAFLSREYPPDSSWGGLATLYQGLAVALAERGHEIHVVCQAAGEPSEAIEGGVFVHRVGTSSKRYSAAARINYSIHAWRKLTDVVRQRGIDVVEANQWGAEGLLCGLKKRAPLVLRLDVSASDLLRARTYSGTGHRLSLAVLSRLEDRAVSMADRVIAISQHTYDWAVRKRGIDPQRVDLVYHGIDTATCRFVQSELREELGVPREAQMILFVGRLETRKGVQTLFQAIPDVLSAMPTARFVLVGQDTNTAPHRGSLQSYLIENASSQGFADSLVFVDFLTREQLVHVYSACDLFVLPSLQEGFSISILEALACGKPVVATAAGGTRDIGLRPPNGILVPPNDAHELAAAMLRLLSLGGADRKLVAEQNRELIETNYSIAAWADNVVRVYEKTLGDEVK